MHWTRDLAKRLSQLSKLARSELSDPVWLGGLFRPTGWITASRQKAAHQQGVSLETLQLHLDIGEVDINGGFSIVGEWRKAM